MKIASWNVNGVRARLDHVSDWLENQSTRRFGPSRNQSNGRDVFRLMPLSHLVIR